MGCCSILFSSLLMLCSQGARKICTQVFPTCLIQPDHLADEVGDISRSLFPQHTWVGRDGTPPIYSHACDLVPNWGWDLSFLQAGWGAAKKPKIAFLSPGKFQHFEMCFGTNTTGKSKLSVDNFAVLTSKDVSKH